MFKDYSPSSSSRKSSSLARWRTCALLVLFIFALVSGGASTARKSAEREAKPSEAALSPSTESFAALSAKSADVTAESASRMEEATEARKEIRAAAKASALPFQTSLCPNVSTQGSFQGKTDFNTVKSQLWYNDGAWWGAFSDGVTGIAFHKHSGTTFIKGDIIDGNIAGKPDALWDGTHLFIMIYKSGSFASFYKYSYSSATQTYTLLPNFPVNLFLDGNANILNIEQDSTGKIWAAYTGTLGAAGDGKVHVIYTVTADHTVWDTGGQVLHSGFTTGITAVEEVAAIVRFGDKIGVAWSNQTEKKISFRYHVDGQPESSWSAEELIDSGNGPQGFGGVADDHMSIKTAPDGRIFLVAKDDDEPAPGTGAHLHLYIRSVAGVWGQKTIVNPDFSSAPTRPILLLDTTNNVAYVFYRDTSTAAGSKIWMAKTSMDSLSFSTPCIFLDTVANNTTGTNQNVTSSTGLLMAASTGTLGGQVVYNTLSLSSPGFEGDVAPRPNGSGTGSVTISDWVLCGRFASGLDTPAAGGEFQRADTAPKATLGGGSITISDWVQCGRYAAALDPIASAGGPLGPASASTSASSLEDLDKYPTVAMSNPSPMSLILQSSREVRVVGGAIAAGQNGTASVELVSLGNENGIGFSVTYDTNNLTFVSAALANGLPAGVAMNVNTSQTASGRVGIALALPSGQTFASGVRPLVVLTFSAGQSASGQTPIGFGDLPVEREVADVAANVLAALFVPGTIDITGQGNPAPVITSLNPPSKTVGSAGFNLTVNGANFVGGSTVQYNGSNRQTTFVSATQLQATITAADVSNVGNFPVTVVNPAPGGGTSNSVIFSVSAVSPNPPPSITNISPASTQADAVGFTLTVNGASFLSTSIVRFNGEDRTTAFVNATQLTALIPASDLADGGVYPVTVVNPAPGGGVSNPVNFTVNNPLPIVSNISPTGAEAGGLPFTLTVNGGNFVEGSVVNFGGNARTTTFVNTTQLTAQILASDIASAGSRSVTVANPAPGGGTSAPSLTFAVSAPPPNSRVVRVSNVVGRPGDPVNVPVELVSQGNENALGLSVTFDPTRLIFNNATRGADASTSVLNVNTSQASNGMIGLAQSLSAGEAFSTGVRQIIVLNFTVPLNSNVASTNIGFGDQPIPRELVSPTTTHLTATFTGGVVTIIQGFEADVFPRPNGDNNGLVTIIDWNQVGRFAAGLDAVPPGGPGGEYQRADCSPKETLGDGVIQISDWVQAGRYAALLDPVVHAGGPTALIAHTQSSSNISADAAREVRVVNANATAGQQTTVAVELEAQGNENAVGFSLIWDTTKLTYVSDAIGAGATNATVNFNRSQTGSGRLGVGLALPAGNVFPVGSQQLVTVTFTANASANGPTSVSFGDQPIGREVVDAAANTLTSAFTAGTVTINPPANPAPSVTSLSPTSATAGGAAFTLTVNGSNFLNTSVVNYNGAARTTTFVNASQLTAQITAADVAAAGSFPVTVTNPAPGGGTSSAVNFTVNPANNPVPSITSLSPTQATTGGAQFTLTVNGSNFVNGAVVRYNGSDRTTAFVNATQLTATITAADIAAAGTFPVTVFNPSPGGGLSNAVNFSVVNPVPTNTFQFSSASFNTNEESTGLQINVTRSGDTSSAATVDYQTANGTATERSDYTTSLGTLQFASGETQQSFLVMITEDSKTEGAESFTVSLSNPTSGVTLGSPSTATINISDDATEPATNANDNSELFVRQHYHDFLNRNTDAGGLQFWVDQIESCGADAQCREIRRLNVSAAFYLSIEFQETGFYVYRLYKAALPPNAQRPQGLPRYREFLRDTQRVGRGVMVGIGDWEQILEQNRQAFAQEFVNRPEFTAQYPANLTHAQYVDALNALAGGALSQAERDALVAGLTGGTETRATALRKVADDADFRQAELNRAFVLMQYIGYLRRSPDDPPDSNLDGLNFWLNKLNAFNGNFINAEMVKSFIVSGEYRGRFSP